jgi:ATP-binding cassette subfamily B protein
MDISEVRGFIRSARLFAILDDAELAELTAKFELKSVQAGEIIFDQGDPGDKFYLIYNGKIRILLRNDKGQEVNLGVRTKGDHFGETALLTDKPRNAAARAVESSVLLVLNRDAFEEFLLPKPALRAHFDKFMRSASVLTFLESCTELSAVPAKHLQELVENFKPEHFDEGEAVIRQGEEPDRFYLIEKGKMQVLRWEGRHREIINFLREGDFFGERAIVEGSHRHADVICLTDCHLFSLDKEAFSKLVKESPKFKKIIEDRIRSYHLNKPPVPYKELIRQELAAERKIETGDVVSKKEVALSSEKREMLSQFTSLYYRKLHFPFIRQHDEMSCGTTCLMMIARYYGKRFSSSRLRELAHVDRSGATLANLASAAEQLGFSTRGMRLEYDSLASVHHPCIVHWQGYHYIVVYKMDAKHVWVADPGLGLRKYTKEFFCKNWNGITLVVEPTPEFKKQKEDKSSVRSFLQFVRPYKLILGEVLLASILLNLFGLATPIFTQNIIDKVLTHNNVSMLNLMLVGMLIVLVFRILVAIVRQYLIVHTSMKIDLKMLVAFYKHLLALPLGYFKVRKIGDFIARFGENMRIRDFLTNTALTLILDTMLVIVYISLMFYYNASLAWMVMVFIPLFVGIALGFTPFLRKLNIDSFAAHAESDSHLIESINGIDTVKAMNMEYHTRWKWEEKFIKNLNIDFKLYNAAIYFHSLGDFVSGLSSTIVLWYGAHEVMSGSLSIGALMAFMALLGSVMTPINRIIVAWDSIQQTLVSIDRLTDVFGAKPEFPESMDDATGLVLREAAGEIVFKDVYFRYGGADDPYILSKINLKIMPGQKVAIVGRSGSGKSTLVRLIPRFYDVTEGRITIDGCDIRTINLANLRRIVGFVLQDNFVFSGTIRENISLGDPEETMEKVIEAARLANANDFIADLPLGYETRIGESGLQLSGGQIQRITIAQVIYRTPRIIILDEATSSLDTESEQVIQRNLDEILRNRTAIIIAHRLSTVRNADNIIVIDSGEIIEEGNHEQLMEKQGLYHYLVHQQLKL